MTTACGRRRSTTGSFLSTKPPIPSASSLSSCGRGNGATRSRGPARNKSHSPSTGLEVVLGTRSFRHKVLCVLPYRQNRSGRDNRKQIRSSRNKGFFRRLV